MVIVTIETDASIYEYHISNEMVEQFPEEWMNVFSYPLFLSHSSTHRDK